MEYPEIIRVLVVDDSAFMRKAIREMLDLSPKIEVVDTAWSAEDALEKMAEHRPDVVTVDLIMPQKDGVWLIRELVERFSAPVVICSSATRSAEKVLEAIEAGAIGFVQKPTALALEQMYKIKGELIEAVLIAAAVPRDRIAPSRSLPLAAPIGPVAYENVDGSPHLDAVVIGISTGGPRALRNLLPRLPANLPVPIVVALHISVGYTAALAQKLNDMSQVEVVESYEGLAMHPGRVILAQAGVNTILHRRHDGKVVTRLDHRLENFLYIPSIDELFRSAAQTYGSRLLGVVMTGMGNDGTAGSAWIKSEGGKIIAESETSSIIYGMPRSVVEAGLADLVVGLDHIPEAIMEAIL